MRIVKTAAAALLFAALLVSVAVYLPLPDRTNEPRREAPPPAAISIRYHDAEQILIASCVKAAQADGEDAFAVFTVDETLVGDAAAGESVYIAAAAEQGRQYLFYLKSVREGEGSGNRRFEPVGEGLILIDDGDALYENENFTLESVREDVKRQQSVMIVPTQKYFYSDFKSLTEASDEMIVGRVLSVSEPTKTVCRAAQKGESTVSTLDQVFMRVMVENGLYGGFKSGDKLNVVLEPSYARPVINATDLTPKTVKTPPETLPKAGGVYLFFLLKSADVKTDLYFTVNPYEGYVPVIGNTIIHPYYNTAMSEINDLDVFAERLRALRQQEG